MLIHRRADRCALTAMARLLEWISLSMLLRVVLILLDKNYTRRTPLRFMEVPETLADLMFRSESRGTLIDAVSQDCLSIKDFFVPMFVNGSLVPSSLGDLLPANNRTHKRPYGSTARQLVPARSMHDNADQKIPRSSFCPFIGRPHHSISLCPSQV